MKRLMITSLSLVLLLLAEVGANASLVWSTAVNHASTSTNQMRSVAVAQQQGNDSVYIGYIQTSGGRYVYRYDTATPYSQLNSLSLTYLQPKGIATDDRGYVFVGNRDGNGSYLATVAVHDSALSAPITTYGANANEFGGIATWKNGANYYLYMSREANGEIYRYDVTDLNAISLDTSFGTNGAFTVPGANKLRGITVANDGTIFVADRDNNSVFRVSSDLSAVTSASVTRPMDVALFGGNAYVTSYNGQNSLIRAFDAMTLVPDEDITIDLLDGVAYSRGTSEGWAGIDIGADGRIWVTDQSYGNTGGTQDRLLVSSPVPEPGTIVLLLTAGLGALCYAGRRRRS